MTAGKLVKLANHLCDIDAIKFGEFETKSGIMSPVYFDLRVIVSHPEIMSLLTDILSDFISGNKITCDNLCGVPYTALPIATLLSVRDSKPMLIRRKETKSYGTKKLIEGKFSTGDISLIIEDVITSGSSILETVTDLKKEGLVVKDAIVVVNREQGGAQHLERNGIKIHSLLTLTELLQILKISNRIDEKVVLNVTKYLAETQVNYDAIVKSNDRTKMSYEKRIPFATCPITKNLFEIMAMKQTNLCLAADLTNAEEILELADQTGPYICMLKTHVDIICDFNEHFINSLSALADKHNFLIMEDRKFADIGNTVSLQYSEGLFHISNWAHLVTAHSLTGASILQGLKNSLGTNQLAVRGVFLLAEISAKDSLITEKYTDDTLKLATINEHSDFIAGIVAQQSNTALSPGLIQLTPGVKIGEIADELGQQYNSPTNVIKERGADIAVVGRGIINAKNPEIAAKLYRDQLWSAYCDRVGITH